MSQNHLFKNRFIGGTYNAISYNIIYETRSSFNVRPLLKQEY